MAKVRLDPKPDQDVINAKSKFMQMQSAVRIFMSSYKSLTPKERIAKLRDLQTALSSFPKEMERLKAVPLPSPSRKFSMDALRDSYGTLATTWRKFEASLLEES